MTAVENWQSIIHKTVRAKDGHLIGSVDAVDDTAVLISTEGARTHYRIPKHIVESFDGHEVSLNATYTKLERFKGESAEGFTEIR
ncbi:MAG TPA: DUF2171 domain-containing protein [Candidatus Nitrosopolaris sp.]|nr:DUF2171 domain-containing protein [Candidatus Nitrosopolaris sp.]